MDRRTLAELLEPLAMADRGAIDVIEDVGASLATHFEVLVEPALDELSTSLSWKTRAALANALGLVPHTPRRVAATVRLVLDPHLEVVAQASASVARELPAAAIEGLRRLARDEAVHAEHLRALARAKDPVDAPAFCAAARADRSELARAGLEALAGLGRVDADTLEALAQAAVRLATRASAVEALSQLVASCGAATFAQVLVARPALRSSWLRVLEVVEPRHQPLIRSITGAADTTTRAAAVPTAPSSDLLRELAGFGAVIDGRRVEHAVRVGDPALVTEAARLLTSPARRGVVLLGATGVGKTSVVHALARHLAALAPPWVVLETSTGEVLAGTRYLGEWETRLKKLVELCRAPARVVLYVTDVHALATQGKSADRDGTFADVLAPYLDRGELAIVAESTEDGLRRGMDRHPALRRVFERVRVPEASESETRAVVRGRLAHATREGLAVVLPPAVLDQLVETAPLHGAGLAQPGAAARLGDQVLEVARDRHRARAVDDDRVEPTIESSDVITALSRATGMPRELLDDRAPFDRARVRAFFEERILGQREAVDVVVELVTLVKAGLTDPDRPYGSLFFVGPTGVGKTEIAKALAEHLYGASDRMVRVDMSELREWDSYEKLIGSARNPSIEGVLTRRVAESPFSVVLLDEIEKAHPNVHDLLLQLLDDGRLTDARGRTTDFRRTVIVMTSNVGSRIEMDAMGFGATGGQAASEEAVLREVRRVFRPELVNRFGRLVVFKPLTPEIVRTLVRRELGKVVLRSGVLRRRLAVDLASEVVDLLAREGFSVAYGARPLKRRVERRVLLPLAEQIVTLGADAAGTILRVTVDQDAVVVRAIAPPAPEAPPTRASAADKPPARDRGALRGRLAELVARASSLADHPRRLEGVRRRTEIMSALGQPTFWDDATLARGAMTELAELDDRESARDTLDRRLEGVADLVREARTPLVAVRAHAALDEIDRALTMLEHRTLISSGTDRADVVLVLTRVGTLPEAGELLLVLARMYEAWAEAHGMAARRLDESRDDAGVTSVALHVVGQELFASFQGEAGLHRLADVGRGKDRMRAAVRVTVLACPDAAPEVHVERGPSRRGRAKLTVHEPVSKASIEVEVSTRDAADADVLRALAAWVGARAAGEGASRDALVRRYGVEDRYAVDEDTGQRFRTKDLALTGLDVVFEARARARLEAARAPE